LAFLCAKENILVLEREDQTVLVSADQIFSSVIEENIVWDDVEPGRAGVRGEFNFSRYPLVPRLLLDQSNQGNPPTLEIWYFKTGSEICCCNLADLQREQVIWGDDWYPIDQLACEEVTSLVVEYSLNLGTFTSLKSFLEVKKLAEVNSLIEDRTRITGTSPISLLPKRVDSPKNINANLYPYQVDGWNWLRMVISEGIGGLLADEMGLGKTLQIISAIADSGSGKMMPVLIVAPGSLLENWRREINKFAPSLSCVKHHGRFRTGDPSILLASEIVITTYESIVSDNSLFMMVHWALVVLDEAQNIKNPEAKRTVAVKKLNRKAGIAVTGTPFENRLLDIWSIFDFACPGYLSDKDEFEGRFCDDVKGGESLEPLISPLMLRRRVSAVAADLPDRIEVPQALELSENEARLYEHLREEIIEEYGKAATLVSLTKLRMFCSHPILLSELSSSHASDKSIASFSKMQRLNELLEEIFLAREKVLIFSSFITTSDLISNNVKVKFNVFSACLDGRVAIDERQLLIDTFSAQEGAASLVLNPRAGGAGLNITAANHVIHYNLEWNPALEDQASARAHRLGQTRPVTIHRLFFADTVEDVVNQRLGRKRELSNVSVVGVTGRQEDYNDILRAIQMTPVIDN
jgi:SNF2 family DNA or RNA helicase